MRIKIRADRAVDGVQVRPRRRTTDAPASSTGDGNEYTRLLQSVYDGVLITDDEGRITDLNRRAAAFLGLGVEQLAGRSVMDFVSGGSAELLEAVRMNLDQHRHTLIEAYCVREDGSMFPAEIAASRVALSEDRQLGFFIRDVTVRRQAEEAREQAMARLEEMVRTRTQFVANVSHELRTPLTSMIYAVANLLRGVVGPLPLRIREYLELLDANCKRLQVTVNDILDLRMIEAHTLALTKSKVTLASVVRKGIEALCVQARQKHQRINVREGDRRWFVECDVRKMERVVANLVGNAIKFTPEGGRIEVTLHALEASRLVILTVTDSGIGIPSEELEKVMQRYYTVGKQPSGSGLGLAIAREIVDMHGGRIAIRSPAPGCECGTAVSVTLSIVDSAKILVASARDAERRHLAEHLAGQGYEVVAVADAGGVIDRLPAEKPDLVLVDLCGCEEAVRDLILRLRSERVTMRMPVVAIAPRELASETGAILRSFSIPTLSYDCGEASILESVTDTLFLSAGTGEVSVLQVERARPPGQ